MHTRIRNARARTAVYHSIDLHARLANRPDSVLFALSRILLVKNPNSKSSRRYSKLRTFTVFFAHYQLSSHTSPSTCHNCMAIIAHGKATRFIKDSRASEIYAVMKFRHARPAIKRSQIPGYQLSGVTSSSCSSRRTPIVSESTRIYECFGHVDCDVYP